MRERKFTMTTFDRSYSELITLPTFEERFRYLKLGGAIGKETFGFDRYLNQAFYSTLEWKNFRRDMIVRDLGCDLGIPDREIGGIIILHHINPISMADIRQRNIEVLLNPENVICVSHNTHNAIHYGDESLLTPSTLVERRPNDTCPWRR
jgi:hypothetical protein